MYITRATSLVSGIDAFEKNLRRLGVGESAELPADQIVPMTGQDPLQHLRTMQDKLPPARVAAEAGAAYVANLKQQKAVEAASR